MTQQPPESEPPRPAAPAYPVPPPPMPRHPQALTVLVLGCVATAGGISTGGLLTVVGPFAWSLGARTKRELAAQPGRWDGEELVNVGYVLGIIGTALLILAIVMWVVTIVVVAGLLGAPT